MFGKLNADTKLIVGVVMFAGAWVAAYAAGKITGNAIEEIYLRED